MAKIKLTKNELKVQKDALKMYQRYLPTLTLKKQQLQSEIRTIEANANKVRNEKEQLENDVKIATLKKGIYDAKEELKRVGDLMKADLVFFELTPVEFDID